MFDTSRSVVSQPQAAWIAMTQPLNTTHNKALDGKCSNSATAVWEKRRVVHTVDGSDIRLKKTVEVGSLSHYLQAVYTSKRWCVGFLNHQPYLVV